MVLLFLMNILLEVRQGKLNYTILSQDQWLSYE